MEAYFIELGEFFSYTRSKKIYTMSLSLKKFLEVTSEKWQK